VILGDDFMLITFQSVHAMDIFWNSLLQAWPHVTTSVSAHLSLVLEFCLIFDLLLETSIEKFGAKEVEVRLIEELVGLNAAGVRQSLGSDNRWCGA
jgi:hypothetical protein